MRSAFATTGIISLIFLFSLFALNVQARQPLNRILESPFYFHREQSDIGDYRVLNREYPIYTDSNTIIKDVPVGVWEVGEGWITPAVPRDINLTRSYNFLFSIWCGGNGEAQLYFEFYAYRNDREIFLFRSRQSDWVGSPTEMLWQHKTKEVTLEVKEGDRLVLRCYINVSVAGRFGLGYDCTQYPSYILDPEEIRYMRGNYWTVNGLFARKLALDQGNAVILSEAFDGSLTGYWGMRAWKRNEVGTETEITGGTAEAIVSRSTVSSGIQSTTWECPETALESTDAIVVRVYVGVSSPPSLEKAEFITEQLGASQLDNVNWTIYYWTQRSVAISGKTHYTDFNSHTVNTQTHRKHILTMDSSNTYAVSRTGTTTAYCAVRWFLVHSDGSETELGTAGTYKAQASRTAAAGTGFASGTYSLAETNIATTDAIRVAFYFRLGNNLFSEADFAEDFITSVIGQPKLFAGTLAVWYYLYKAVSYWQLWFGWRWDAFIEDYVPNSYVSNYRYTAVTTLGFRIGSSTYNSRIENFTWTEAIEKAWYHIANWTLNLYAMQWNHITNWLLNLYTLQWYNIAEWQLSLLARQWNNIGTWLLNLRARTWTNIAEWNFTLIARLWQNISTWSLNLYTIELHNIANWTMNLYTLSWNNIATWILNLPARTWQTISTWDFNLAVLGWHTITLWHFYLETELLDMTAMAIGVLCMALSFYPLLSDDELTKALAILGLVIGIIGVALAEMEVAVFAFIITMVAIALKTTKKD